MTGRLFKVGLLLLLALTAALALWAYRGLEWREQEVDLGYGEQARRNPFLAASLFLEAQGEANEVRRGFGLLDSLEGVGPQDTLILIDGYRTLGPSRLERVWRWVKGGGHLIVSTRNRFIGGSDTRPDPLLARLGVVLAEGDAAAQEASSPAEDDPCEGEAQITRIHFTDEPRLLCIELRGTQALVDADQRASAWAGNADGPQLMQFDVGDGLVTVTTDNRLWSNPRIDDWDHAYLLWLFAGDGKVWFLFNRDAPSLWSLLWRLSPWGFAALALALGLWLWRSGVRFGPLLAPPSLHRRRFLEHTDAGARFLWQRGQAALLIEPLRAEIWQRMERRHRRFRSLPRERQLELLARVSGLEAQQLLPALYQPAGSREPELFRQVHYLQRIRNRL